MRFGMRKPSVKRMIKARTTGRAKRAVKKAVIPGYGRRGMGFVKNPKRSVKGAIYRRTTFSVWDLFREQNLPPVYCMYNVSTVIQGGEHYEYNS